MRNLFIFPLYFWLALGALSVEAHAFEVFNLNVFDQLQGEWPADFRARRMRAIADYLQGRDPDLVVFQEAQGNEDRLDSADVDALKKLYPYRHYVHEMTGADGASYGYWMGAKIEPSRWIEDGFSFRGGVDRRVQGAVFADVGDGECLGVLSLHLSYQNSAVRVKEADWLLNWVKKKEGLCRRWLVVGDFNADEGTPEMLRIFTGLLPFFDNKQPTVGPYNPIRRIYGADAPSRTIDWALGRNLEASAEVVLIDPWKGEWVSDHAGILVTLKQAREGKKKE